MFTYIYTKGMKFNKYLPFYDIFWHCLFWGIAQGPLVAMLYCDYPQLWHKIVLGWNNCHHWQVMLCWCCRSNFGRALLWVFYLNFLVKKQTCKLLVILNEINKLIETLNQSTFRKTFYNLPINYSKTRLVRTLI